MDPQTFQITAHTDGEPVTFVHTYDALPAAVAAAQRKLARDRRRLAADLFVGQPDAYTVERVDPFGNVIAAWSITDAGATACFDLVGPAAP